MDYRGEGNPSPKISETEHGDKGNKKKEEWKSKVPKDVELKRSDASKDKKSISCWICEREHYLKDFPLKQKLSTFEQIKKPIVGVM